MTLPYKLHCLIDGSLKCLANHLPYIQFYPLVVYAVYWSTWLAQTTSIPLPSTLSEEKSLSVVAAATATAVGNLTYGSIGGAVVATAAAALHGSRPLLSLPLLLPCMNADCQTRKCGERRAGGQTD